MTRAADLAGKFAGRGYGFATICSSAGVPVSCSSVSPTLVPFNDTLIWQLARDAAGNSCGVTTETLAPVSGTTHPAFVNTRTHVGTNASFDPTTGSGTETFKRYRGGSCIGAAFDKTGATLTSTGTGSFVVSDSGDRFEFIWTSYISISPVAGNAQGLVFSETLVRQ